ncbi:DUF1109 domain-containing protein [Acidisoma cellulosilytica]|uniref:DUF1109 domain-containing protein n=1 Tax=Acidisoma cellulosilyticum TaxID=2802395 RepID=A0A963Z152_9PROT|nr:NrsF family protein [Acidisoma cellulosilyticum]MCB8879935.1 DUF1109 domain-containing protein [Acidisoma cellulosilyticum]
MSDTDFIVRLATEAGQGCGSARFGRPLLLGTLGAFVVAIALILAVFAGTFDAASVLQSYPFHFKEGTMLLLAAGAFWLLHQQGIPGTSDRAAWALLPGPLLLCVLALTDGSGYPLLGRDSASVPICYFAILGAAVPALAILLYVSKRGVVTRPGRAGAVAGILAGALGAAAYAIACKNDGARFVILWYGAAVGTITCAGAVIGQRYLRW